MSRARNDAAPAAGQPGPGRDANSDAENPITSTAPVKARSGESCLESVPFAWNCAACRLRQSGECVGKAPRQAALIDWALRLDIPPAARLVLVALLRRYGPASRGGGRVFPRQATLAATLGMSERTVRRHGAKLVGAGAIETFAVPSERGRFQRQAYRFLHPSCGEIDTPHRPITIGQDCPTVDADHRTERAPHHRTKRVADHRSGLTYRTLKEEELEESSRTHTQDARAREAPGGENSTAESVCVGESFFEAREDEDQDGPLARPPHEGGEVPEASGCDAEPGVQDHGGAEEAELVTPESAAARGIAVWNRARGRNEELTPSDVSNVKARLTEDPGWLRRLEDAEDAIAASDVSWASSNFFCFGWVAEERGRLEKVARGCYVPKTRSKSVQRFDAAGRSWLNKRKAAKEAAGVDFNGQNRAPTPEEREAAERKREIDHRVSLALDGFRRVQDRDRGGVYANVAAYWGGFPPDAVDLLRRKVADDETFARDFRNSAEVLTVIPRDTVGGALSLKWAVEHFRELDLEALMAELARQKTSAKAERPAPVEQRPPAKPVPLKTTHAEREAQSRRALEVLKKEVAC
ncbi:MAG: hypothetical protein GF355_07035 [Candidatus Eisenbacteria bacterium]|nr:hypothetical protein [Candidatus Eisenbacteria bacterium]